MNEKISSSRLEQMRPYIIFGLGTLFYVYEFFLRVIPSAITQPLMLDLQITAEGFGMIASIFYWSYAPMQIPVGLLYDRFNASNLLIMAMVVCTLSTVLFALSINLFMAELAFFLIGFASSFAFVGTLVLASRCFAPKYFAFIAGFVQLLGCVGSIIGQHPIAIAVEYIGWRYTTLWAAFAGAIIVALFWFFGSSKAAENSKSANVKTTCISSNYLHEEWQRLREVCKKPQTWWVAVYSFCCWAPIAIFASAWGPAYLIMLYQTNAEQATLAIGAIWVGIGIGSPLIGAWSDRIRRRCLPLTLCALIGLISAIAIFYCPLNWAMMYVALFFYGLAASSQTLSFGVVQDNNPPTVAGTAVGFNNMAVILNGVILLPFIGIILHKLWDGKIANGAPVYSIHDYQTAMVMIPLCSLIALIVSIFFIKETHCQPQHAMKYKFDQSTQETKNSITI